jgi:hypothetical protein
VPAAKPSWSVPLPPAWPGARTPVLAHGVAVVSAHRQVPPDADGDVVVALGFDAATGAARFQLRGASGGKPVRSGPVGALEGGTFAVGMVVENGSVSFHRFDGGGRARGRGVVVPTCAVTGQEHVVPGELARSALGRPRAVPGGGALVSWVVESTGCLERWDVFGERPRWAAPEMPHLATPSLVLTAAVREEDLFLVARDLETGEVRWERAGSDLIPLAAAGGLIFALDPALRADEIEARLEDDPEMTDGHPLIEAPVRLVGLDAASGAERWSLDVEGDVGSAVLDGADLVLSAAREDGSGTLRRVGGDGSERSRLAIDAPPTEEFADPPPWLGVPRILGVHRGAAIWQGPDGLGALRLDGGAPREEWRLDDRDVRADALLARTDAPLWAGPPDGAVDGGVLVLRTGDRLRGFALG